jgi:hypothetical protein
MVLLGEISDGRFDDVGRRDQTCVDRSAPAMSELALALFQLDQPRGSVLCAPRPCEITGLAVAEHNPERPELFFRHELLTAPRGGFHTANWAVTAPQARPRPTYRPGERGWIKREEPWLVAV